jgi:serine/threonine-protein kinase
MNQILIGQPLSWTQKMRIEVIRVVYDALNITGRALYQVKNESNGLLYAMKVFDNSQNDLRVIHSELIALNRQLQLPTILPRFHNIFSHDGLTYVLMDWMEGESFDIITKEQPVIDRETAVYRITMLIELAKTIEKIHQVRFIHRDIKPQNVLLKNRKIPREGVAVIDFGLTAQSRHFEEGTMDYQAPEQAGRRDYNLGPATDVFGIGQVGWFLFRGTPLTRFPNDTVTDWAGSSEINLIADDLKIRGINELQNILLKAMNYHPKERFENASKLKIALMNIQRSHFS